MLQKGCYFEMHIFKKKMLPINSIFIKEIIDFEYYVCMFVMSN